MVLGALLAGVLLVGTVVLTGCTTSGTAQTVSSAVIDGSTGPLAEPSVSAGPTSVSAGPTSVAPSSTDSSAPSGPSSPVSTAPAVTQTVVQLEPGTSDEASGIAASTRVPGAYFLVDDGAGTDDVVAVGSDGAVIARIAVDGMSARNAEALASGTCGGPAPDGSSTETCLYVGDIGDNSARRVDIGVWRIAEPDPAHPPTDPVPSDEWRYTYPDGPHNAEGMLVAPDGSLIVVTKPPAQGGAPHRMYRAAPGGGELTFVREFRPPPAARPLRTLFTGNVVTDLASSPGRVLLLTYDEVQEFTAPDPAADITTFPDWPHRKLPSPSLPQAEGITSALDGCGYVLASEAGPAGTNGSMGIVSCS